MVEEYEKARRRQVSSARAIMDYVMGLVFAAIGVFFCYVFFSRTPLMDRKPSLMDLGIGGLFLLYGVWRIYRGYKKNYFRE